MSNGAAPTPKVRGAHERGARNGFVSSGRPPHTSTPGGPHHAVFPLRMSGWLAAGRYRRSRPHGFPFSRRPFIALAQASLSMPSPAAVGSIVAPRFPAAWSVGVGSDNAKQILTRSFPCACAAHWDSGVCGTRVMHDGCVCVATWPASLCRSSYPSARLVRHGLALLSGFALRTTLRCSAHNQCTPQDEGSRLRPWYSSGHWSEWLHLQPPLIRQPML